MQSCASCGYSLSLEPDHLVL